MNVDTIREAIRQQPFIPFVLRMNDGRTFNVPHPEYIALTRRHVYVVDPETDAGMFLEPRLIASLEPKDQPPQSTTAPSPGEKA